MKVLIVDNNWGQIKSLSPHFSNISDTAILSRNKPFFIPQFATPCIAKLYLVVKISRLGRSIPERFAHRYYREVSIGVVFTAQNLWNEALSKGLPCDYARSFDGAVNIGQFVPKENNTQYFPLSIRLNTDKEITMYHNQMNFSIEFLIAYISSFQLLRQGDLLLIGTPDIEFEVHIGDHIDGFLAEKQCLSFNIK